MRMQRDMTTSREALAEALTGMDLEDVFQRAFADALAGVGRLEALKRRELLTPPEVEELYGIKEGTLKVWRCRGGGPAYHQSQKGSPVLYAHEDIISFLRRNRVRETG